MLRKALLALALTIAAPSFVVTDAYAGYTKEELNLEKDEAKYNKAVSKSVGKLVKKWHKATDKDKPTKDIEKELKQYFSNELKDLKDKGIELKDDPGEVTRDPRYPGRAVPADDEEKGKLVKLRDMVQDLKGGDLKDKTMGKKLDSYVELLEKRAERSMDRYKKHKKNA